MSAKSRGNYRVGICLRAVRCVNAERKCGECFKHRYFCMKVKEYGKGDWGHVEGKNGR